LARMLIRPGTTSPAGAPVAPYDLAAPRRDDLAAPQRDDLAAPRRAVEVIPAAQPSDHSGARRRVRRRWALLVAAGWLLQTGVRLWFSRGQSVPLANPDESAYLIAARVLAGGPATDFSYSTLYQGGYPLLITPVYWFTSNAVAVYHAVLAINAAAGALLMPLAYVTARRLGLVRPAAYTVAMVTALLPAGLFYAEYAMTDAIYPVLVLAWLLTVHSWLTARSARGQYLAAAGSALLTGYAYAVHSRGTVMVFGYVAVGVLVAWRRLAPRRTVAAAALALAASVGGGWLLNRYLSSAMYPEGTRNLSAQMASTLHSVHGAINVFEMAAGQYWRLVLDSWGLAGIGLIAAATVVLRPRFRTDLRIMAALSLAVSLVTAVTAPAALPSDQSQTWASGRYLDGFIVTYFVVGAVVLLRARPRLILICAGITAATTAVAAMVVSVYAGSSLPASTFPGGFSFGEPAVLAQNWNNPNVFVSTAVALGLLGVWVLIGLGARRWSAVVWGVRVSRVLRALAVAGVAAVSLVAVTQMTNHVSRANTPAQAASTTGFVAATGLKPGDQIAVAFTVGINLPATDVPYYLWAPQAFEVSRAELEFFNPAQAPPAGVNVVETGWPAGQPASAGWPGHPAGWRIVASDQAAGWVAWRHT
jgi:Dolichyl-phosphate-mannose-protein mannosyltransferase